MLTVGRSCHNICREKVATNKQKNKIEPWLLFALKYLENTKGRAKRLQRERKYKEQPNSTNSGKFKFSSGDTDKDEIGDVFQAKNTQNRTESGFTAVRNVASR